METIHPPCDTTAMTETDADALFHTAVQLAHDTFEDATDEHVLGVYARLLWNRQRGLDAAGAATVH